MTKLEKALAHAAGAPSAIPAEADLALLEDIDLAMAVHAGRVTRKSAAAILEIPKSKPSGLATWWNLTILRGIRRGYVEVKLVTPKKAAA